MITTNQLPDKSRSLRESSVLRRLETERKRGEPKQRRKIGKMTLSKYRRKCANAKERQRMAAVNTMFEKLRTIVPEGFSAREEEKETKVTTLRSAITYINELHKLLVDYDSGRLDPTKYQDRPSLANPVRKQSNNNNNNNNKRQNVSVVGRKVSSSCQVRRIVKATKLRRQVNSSAGGAGKSRRTNRKSTTGIRSVNVNSGQTDAPFPVVAVADSTGSVINSIDIVGGSTTILEQANGYAIPAIANTSWGGSTLTANQGHVGSCQPLISSYPSGLPTVTGGPMTPGGSLLQTSVSATTPLYIITNSPPPLVTLASSSQPGHVQPVTTSSCSPVSRITYQLLQPPPAAAGQQVLRTGLPSETLSPPQSLTSSPQSFPVMLSSCSSPSSPRDVNVISLYISLLDENGAETGQTAAGRLVHQDRSIDTSDNVTASNGFLPTEHPDNGQFSQQNP